MSDQHYYMVGIHGAPTRETAPHGFMVRSPSGNTYPSRDYEAHWLDKSSWAPLPEFPTEQAPAPEPVKRWGIWTGGETSAVLMMNRDTRLPLDEAQAAAAALNALDREGVAWGPGHPAKTLPATGRVIVLLTAEHGKGDEFYAYSAEVAHKSIGRVRCWWPLPLPREAT